MPRSLCHFRQGPSAPDPCSLHWLLQRSPDASAPGDKDAPSHRPVRRFGHVAAEPGPRRTASFVALNRPPWQCPEIRSLNVGYQPVVGRKTELSTVCGKRTCQRQVKKVAQKHFCRGSVCVAETPTSPSRAQAPNVSRCPSPGGRSLIRRRRTVHTAFPSRKWLPSRMTTITAASGGAVPIQDR